MKNLILFLLLALSSSMINAQKQSAKMVLMESSCAKLCAPCYDHIKKTNALYRDHIHQIAMVVYNQSPIGVGQNESTKPYMGFYNTFGIDYQSSVMIDRTFFPDNYDSQEGTDTEIVGSETPAFEEQIKKPYVPVAISIVNSYDPLTRAVNISLTANFSDTASGDLRFYLVLTQDTVKGPDTYAYSQAVIGNVGDKIDGYVVVSYSGGITAINGFPHINAVKYQPSGFFGNAGIISGKPAIGSSYTEKFSFILPKKNDPSEAMDIDPKRIQIVAAVVKKGPFNKRIVLNANKKYLTTTTTAVPENITNGIQFNVTNPVSNAILLSYSSVQEGVGELVIYNASGEIIKTINQVEYNQSISNKTIDISDLSNGIYFVSLKAEGTTHTRKVIVVK